MAGFLLVVNDEPETGRALQGALASEGFDVILATDEAEALEVVHDTEPDAVIVDVVEPDARGAALCRRLREARPRLPVLMLGVGDPVVERTGGLAVDADDYLAKPFVLVELLTRIRGLLRRNRGSGSEVLRFADLVLDPTTHEVVRSGRRIELTLIEFTLLELFLSHPREVLPRGLIFTTVWGFDFGSTSNALNVRIGQLRRKLEAGGKPRLIHTDAAAEGATAPSCLSAPTVVGRRPWIPFSLVACRRTCRALAPGSDKARCGEASQFVEQLVLVTLVVDGGMRLDPALVGRRARAPSTEPCSTDEIRA